MSDDATCERCRWADFSDLDVPICWRKEWRPTLMPAERCGKYELDAAFPKAPLPTSFEDWADMYGWKR